MSRNEQREMSLNNFFPRPHPPPTKKLRNENSEKEFKEWQGQARYKYACLSLSVYIYIFMVCPFFCFLFFTILQQEWRTSCCIVVEHILDYLVKMTLKTPSTRTQKRQVAILFEAVSSIAQTINWLLLLLMGTKMNVWVSVSKLCEWKFFYFLFFTF